jgi:hypothetical protein
MDRRICVIVFSMRRLQRPVVILHALMCAGCFQMTTVLKVKGDGSGTLDHRMVYAPRALAQMRSLGGLGAGAGQAIDPSSEAQARALAAAIGPGVTYVTSTPVSTPLGQGRDATYAFSDVTQLRISTQPATPPGVSISTPALKSDAETVTFSLTHDPSGHAILHIHVPEPNFLDALGSQGASSQIPMIKTLLGGAHVLLMVEPEGALVRTSSPFADASRVTLLEIDLDRVLQDDTLIARLQAAKTQDDAKAAVREAAGVKINLDREITVEFTPAK